MYELVLRAHAAIYQRTDGLVGHRLLGVPTLLLHTTGRRSGRPRTNALVYARDDGAYLVVPSKGGADQAPGWLHNVRAQPAVEIQIGRKRQPATATVVERDDPRFAQLWKAVNDNNAGRYDQYQSQTARPIPVVVLAPRD
jgi:deazaflavin-dependent oxidoreductase (nitroreductase family)